MNNLTRKSMPTSGLASFLGSSFKTNLSFWNNNAPIPITDTNFVYSSEGLTNRQMCKFVKKMVKFEVRLLKTKSVTKPIIAKA